MIRLGWKDRSQVPVAQAFLVGVWVYICFEGSAIVGAWYGAVSSLAVKPIDTAIDSIYGCETVLRGLR